MRLIDADPLEQAYDDKYTLGDCGKRERDDVVNALRYAPTVDAVPVVRCKECKHRPKYDGPNRLVFPDCICPCQCDDCYYNWMPPDDWFCADSERKE